MKIEETPLPDNALLQKYVTSGDYTDCFSTLVEGKVSQADFIEAFYNSRVFRLERFVLTILVFKPSSDKHAKQLAIGTRETYAAWNLEARNDNQILMCDFQQATRSWLMTQAEKNDDADRTRLYFGTAVVAKKSKSGDAKKLPFLVRLLTPAHRLYSRRLLASAAARLKRQN